MGRPGDHREGRRQGLHRRRQRARQLKAEGWSIRAIARELGVAASTVHDYLHHEPRPNVPPPEEGNQRARTHGVWSAPLIAELQAQYREKAQARWPFLTADDVETWSRLAARVEQAAAHETQAGALAAAGDRVHNVSMSLVQWEERLRRLTAAHDVEAERRAAEQPAGRVGEGDDRDPDVVIWWRLHDEKLGMGERARLRALRHGWALCRAHPATGYRGQAGCTCRRGGAEARSCDDSERRQRERDRAATRLSDAAREGLAGGLLAARAVGAARAAWEGSGHPRDARSAVLGELPAVVVMGDALSGRMWSEVMSDPALIALGVAALREAEGAPFAHAARPAGDWSFRVAVDAPPPG